MLDYKTLALEGIDLDGYPEDVRPWIGTVCKLWYLRPPAAKKSKGYWIQSAHELADAAGEFGLEALVDYRRVFEDYMSEHRGIAQHTVEGPGSLVKMVRAHAGTMREGVSRSERYMRQDERSRRRYGE